MFDFSNYSKDSKFFDETNKKVIGKMKDEFGGVIVDEFVGLKSKMYSIKKIDGKECNTAKGVNIATEFNEFEDVLFNKKIVRHKMRRIQAKKHKLGTYEIDKISLLCFDDKRLFLDDELHTLAYFHKDSVTGCKEIQKGCDKKKEIKKIVIKKKRLKKILKRVHVSNKIIFFLSSNENEAIRAILNLFILFYKKISHTQKA